MGRARGSDSKPPAAAPPTSPSSQLLPLLLLVSLAATAAALDREKRKPEMDKNGKTVEKEMFLTIIIMEKEEKILSISRQHYNPRIKLAKISNRADGRLAD
ncbi:hypothetical protein TKK_0013183 [Trichogramma kaykai]